MTSNLKLPSGFFNQSNFKIILDIVKFNNLYYIEKNINLNGLDYRKIKTYYFNDRKEASKFLKFIKFLYQKSDNQNDKKIIFRCKNIKLNKKLDKEFKTNEFNLIFKKYDINENILNGKCLGFWFDLGLFKI